LSICSPIRSWVLTNKISVRSDSWFGLQVPKNTWLDHLQIFIIGLSSKDT
jgi:hypothetical protein